VQAYKAAKPALDSQAPWCVVRITSITGVVEENSGGTALPLYMVASDVMAQMVSSHEYSASESRQVKRNSVNNSITSWKPLSLPPGCRIHEHDKGPSASDRKSIPGPSPIEPELAARTAGALRTAALEP